MCQSIHDFIFLHDSGNYIVDRLCTIICDLDCVEVTRDGASKSSNIVHFDDSGNLNQNVSNMASGQSPETLLRG